MLCSGGTVPKESVLKLLMFRELRVHGKAVPKNLLTFVKFRKLRVDGEEPSSKKERPKVPNVPVAPRVAC